MGVCQAAPPQMLCAHSLPRCQVADAVLLEATAQTLIAAEVCCREPPGTWDHTSNQALRSNEFLSCENRLKLRCPPVEVETERRK